MIMIRGHSQTTLWLFWPFSTPSPFRYHSLFLANPPPDKKITLLRTDPPPFVAPHSSTSGESSNSNHWYKRDIYFYLISSTGRFCNCQFHSRMRSVNDARSVRITLTVRAGTLGTYFWYYITENLKTLSSAKPPSPSLSIVIFCFDCSP